MLLRIIDHLKSEIQITISPQGSPLNARNKEFVIQNNQLGVKEFKLSYPKTLYLALQPVNKSYVKLKISF